MRFASYNTTADTGEVNTASNVGAGVGVFKSKTGVNLAFKSLAQGTTVKIATSGADEVKISGPIGNDEDSGRNNVGPINTWEAHTLAAELAYALVFFRIENATGSNHNVGVRQFGGSGSLIYNVASGANFIIPGHLDSASKIELRTSSNSVTFRLIQSYSLYLVP